MEPRKDPLRARFETERRRTAFMAALPAILIGIIAGDTWIHPVAGLLTGPLLGAVAYGFTYAWDTWQWRRHHG
jgi:hypothetical protein